jgi:hypothetical protein
VSSPPSRPTLATTHAAVLHCPFCAEEDLHPVEEHGGWECRSCLRVFSVKLLGLARRQPSLARGPIGSPANPSSTAPGELT